MWYFSISEGEFMIASERIVGSGPESKFVIKVPFIQQL
jgi:hypothetical protein